MKRPPDEVAMTPSSIATEEGEAPEEDMGFEIITVANLKKLMQAEVKIRQLTQATVKDLKLRLKQKQSEIYVIK